MTPTTNGHRPAVMPIPVLQLNPSGQLVPIVADDGDRPAMLLDELDDCLTTLDTALADQAAALQLLSEADRKVSITRARCRALHAAIAVELADGSGRAYGRA